MKIKPGAAAFASPMRWFPKCCGRALSGILKTPIESSSRTVASRSTPIRSLTKPRRWSNAWHRSFATRLIFNQAAARGDAILLEGAQATLLDVDHGTYPFVTSSNTVIGGALIGTGLAPQHLTGVLGIVRTYTTRVGEGPFPTEMLDGEAAMGQLIRERGREYGASTGRPRRCGWFDAFATRYAARSMGLLQWP